MAKYKIVVKRDFPRSYGKVGFYDNGKWISSGFVVTDGICNVMPGATWFRTVEQAVIAITILEKVKHDADAFWTEIRKNKQF